MLAVLLHDDPERLVQDKVLGLIGRDHGASAQHYDRLVLYLCTSLVNPELNRLKDLIDMIVRKPFIFESQF